MGVSGSGKSFIGKKLADVLKCSFVEGDDYHSQSNKDKMHKGNPLDDMDRHQWLNDLKSYIESSSDTFVLSCSALKKSYRKILQTENHQTIFIHLELPTETLKKRLESRKGHFFSPSLLDDQLETLESITAEENGFTVYVDRDSEKIIAEIKTKLDDMHHHK